MASSDAPSRNGVDCPAYSSGSGGQTDAVNGCSIQQVTQHGPLLDGAVEVEASHRRLRVVKYIISILLSKFRSDDQQRFSVLPYSERFFDIE